jgi:hypothetical protein
MPINKLKAMNRKELKPQVPLELLSAGMIFCHVEAGDV